MDHQFDQFAKAAGLRIAQIALVVDTSSNENETEVLVNPCVSVAS